MARRNQNRVQPHAGKQYGKWVMQQDQTEVRQLIIDAEVLVRKWLPPQADDEDVMTLARVMTAHHYRAAFRQEQDE